MHPECKILLHIPDAVNMSQPINHRVELRSGTNLGISEMFILYGNAQNHDNTLVINNLLPSFETETEGIFMPLNFTAIHMYCVKFCVNTLKMLGSTHFSLMYNMMMKNPYLSKFLSCFTLPDLVDFLQVHSIYFFIDINGVLSLKNYRIQTSSVLATENERINIHRLIEIKAAQYFCTVLWNRTSVAINELKRSLSCSPGYIQSYMKCNFKGDKLLIFFQYYQNIFIVDGSDNVQLKPGVSESMMNSMVQSISQQIINVHNELHPNGDALVYKKYQSPNDSYVQSNKSNSVGSSVLYPPAKQKTTFCASGQPSPVDRPHLSSGVESLSYSALLKPFEANSEAKTSKGFFSQELATASIGWNTVQNFPTVVKKEKSSSDVCDMSLKSAPRDAAETFNKDLEEKCINIFKNILKFMGKPVSVCKLFSYIDGADPEVKSYLLVNSIIGYDLSVFFHRHSEYFLIDQNGFVSLRK